MDWVFLKEAKASKPVIDVERVKNKPLTVEFVVRLGVTGFVLPLSAINKAGSTLQSATTKFLKALDKTPVVTKTRATEISTSPNSGGFDLLLKISCVAWFDEDELHKAYENSPQSNKTTGQLVMEFLQFSAKRHGMW